MEHKIVTLRFLGLVMAVACAVFPRADAIAGADDDPVSVATVEVATLDLEQLDQSRPVITVSRAADLVGSPVIPIFSLAKGEIAVLLASRLPFARSSLSSGFGSRQHPILGRWRQHNGLDFAVPQGSTVSAPAPGEVVRAGWAGNYGNMVAIRHADGFETRYAHLSSIAVSVGEEVEADEIIGQVGTTGLSTGPHLHYEVLHNGRAVNPLS